MTLLLESSWRNDITYKASNGAHHGVEDMIESETIRSRSMNLDRVAMFLFVDGLIALIFLSGVFVGRLGTFPYPVLNAGWDAALDRRDHWREHLGLATKHHQPSTRTAGGVTVHDHARAFPGSTLVATCLLDAGGKTVSRWNGTPLGDAGLIEVDPATRRAVRIIEGEGDEAFHAEARGGTGALARRSGPAIGPIG